LKGHAVSSKGWNSKTIASLIQDGTIVAHKDGNYGSNYPRASEFGSEGILFLTAKLLDDSGRIDFDTASRLSNDKAKKLTYGFIETGDVLLSHNATIGRVSVVPDLREPVLVGTSLTYFRLNHQRLSPLYLAAYFKGRDFQHQLEAVMSHSTRNQVPITAQRKLKVVLPPLNEQRAIAHILGTLDDKIENNRRMNETLEAMARAIFKSWFVDFDPVRAKMEGRQPVGMDAETAALFPDSFEDSPLGKIPKGWKVGTLPEFIDVNPSYRISKGSPAPYLDMKNMPTQGHRAISWFDREFSSGTKFTNGDTLLARITPCLENGKTCLVDFLDEGEIGWGSTEYIVLRPKEPLPSFFVYLLARSEEFRNFAIQNMTGSSGRQRVPPTSMELYSVCIPSNPVSIAFEQIAKPIIEKVRENAQEGQTLAATRDALLPKLLSGDIRVPDAENWIEAGDPPVDGKEEGKPKAKKRVEVSGGDGEEEDSGERVLDIGEFSTEEIMAEFRKATRQTGEWDREELLREVAYNLGYQRLGPRIAETLKGHLRAALRRGVLSAVGPNVACLAPTMADYTIEEIIDTFQSVMTKGREYDREEVIESVAHHLGFTRLRDTVRDPIKSALNGAIRRGILGYQGNVIWRET
jgi:type I restriction enzyme S subunit